MFQLSKYVRSCTVTLFYQKLRAILSTLVKKIPSAFEFFENGRMLTTFDRMIAQKSYRHIWKAETFINICIFPVPSFYQKFFSSAQNPSTLNFHCSKMVQNSKILGCLRVNSNLVILLFVWPTSRSAQIVPRSMNYRNRKIY